MLGPIAPVSAQRSCQHVSDKTNPSGPAEERDPAPAQRTAATRQGLAWSSDFAGTEHPETARLRLHKSNIDTIAALKRESIDQTYAYLVSLLDKAKEEMAHCRSSSNEVRRAMMQQHVDELVAYVAGHGIIPKLPNRYGDTKGPSLAGYYVLEEVPAFLGEVKFLIDLWYEKGLAKVHDEVAALVGLNRAAPASRPAQPAAKAPEAKAA
jgi:hypothetical protein